VIQGFFDAEGSFMLDKKGRFYTTACSINGDGLKSIAALLSLRGYPATVGCDRRGQWKVGVGIQREVRRFASEIGSRIDYKAEKMRLCLAATAVAEAANVGC
jgi:intein-encoded DNA endonuclease-like protein